MKAIIRIYEKSGRSLKIRWNEKVRKLIFEVLEEFFFFIFFLFSSTSETGPDNRENVPGNICL